MKLETYSTPHGQHTDSETYIRVYKNTGTIYLSSILINRLKIEVYSFAKIHCNKQDRKEWFIEFGDDGVIIKPVAKRMRFNCLSAVRTLLKDFELSGNSAKFLVDCEPIVEEQKNLYKLKVVQ